jgi:hypothetical protein
MRVRNQPDPTDGGIAHFQMLADRTQKRLSAALPPSLRNPTPPRFQSNLLCQTNV